MFCPSCGVKIKESVKFCGSCGKAFSQAPLSKRPVFKINFNKKILIPVFLLIIILVGAVFIFNQFKKKKTSAPKRNLLATYDQYPIWLLRDGKVAVYREMKVYDDKIEKQIVVKNLSDKEQKDVKIYEEIPKEISSLASDVVFDPQPEIVEEDPQVKWEVDVSLGAESEGVVLSWKAKNWKYVPLSIGTKSKKVLGEKSEESLFLKHFLENWPTLNQEDPVEIWLRLHDFSQKEMQKSAKQAMAGKTITVAKDITDVAATLATGTGIFDTINLASELYSIGTTIYSDDTKQLFGDMGWWFMAAGVVKNGVDNKELLKAAVKTGVEAIKARQGLKAAATTQKLAEAANKIDPKTGVTAAESFGLNIAGVIVDYAVINEVAKVSKYAVFEMTEQAKMEYASRHLVDLWKKYKRGDLTEPDAKKIVELEILFFMAQQKELGVRKAYFISQQGVLDTAFSWLPVVGKNSAKAGAKEAEETRKLGERQMKLRYSAREVIYNLAEEEEAGLAALKKKELEAVNLSEKIQSAKEKISRVVESGSKLYAEIKDKVRQSAEKGWKKASEAIPTQKPESRSTKSPRTSGSKKTELSFSLDNFPKKLLGLPKVKTNTALNEQNECNKRVSLQAFIEALYGSEDKIISARVMKLAGKSKAEQAVKTLAGCMKDLYALEVNVEEKNSVLGYPFSQITAEAPVGKIIDSSFVVVKNYLFGVSILTPEKTGGKESEHRQAMNEVIQAFLKESSQTEEAYVSEPTPKTSSGCQKIDLSDVEVFKVERKDRTCSPLEVSKTSSKFEANCQTSAVYRIYGLKEISTGGKDKISVKASLSLKDPARLFPKGGVHYDDYVDLIAFSKKPEGLSSCGKVLGDSGWGTECNVKNTSSGVLAHCGVAKNSTSKSCNFSVDTQGKDKLYLLMATADAWSHAKVIGGFSDVEVCY